MQPRPCAFPLALNFFRAMVVRAMKAHLLQTEDFAPPGALACLTWLIVAAIFRFSSLAALAALALAPTSAWLFDRLLVPPLGSTVGYGPLALLAVLIAGLVFARHEGNIRRLLSGTEPRIGAAKSKSEP